jgi:hypothetical protein
MGARDLAMRRVMLNPRQKTDRMEHSLTTPDFSKVGWKLRLIAMLRDSR